MSNWRDIILTGFEAGAGQLTLVDDADNLLAEEQIIAAIRAKGYELLEYDDPIAFRYRYETEYRAAWQRGETRNLIVILPPAGSTHDQIPYDLLQIGRRLVFSLHDIFPLLSGTVLAELDRSLLDRVWRVRPRHGTQRLSDNETRDLLLRSVFAVNLDQLRGDANLLRTLIQLHYTQQPLPAGLAGRLIELIEQNHGAGDGWPLHEIVGSAAAFYAFLQERWPIFLRSYAKTLEIKERPATALRYRGPEYLPFDDPDIRVYVDNLFIEGKLTPVTVTEIAPNLPEFVRWGIVGEHDRERVERLIATIREALPADNALYSDWTAFALRWAELGAVLRRGDADEHLDTVAQIGNEIDTRFNTWLAAKYGGLTSLAADPPAMVHRIARRMERVLHGDQSRRVALLVIDGLALEQWVVVRQALTTALPGHLLNEGASFAWIPTLTNISRQAIFAGKIPAGFPNSFEHTNAEKNHWQAFWEERGLRNHEIVYQRSLGNGPVDAVFNEHIREETRVVGLVIDSIDEMMHGATLGAKGLHAQLKLWLQGGFLAQLIDRLTQLGFEIWLTADHGNLECRGCGAPKDGSLADKSGQRVRLYKTEELRQNTASVFPSAQRWEPVGLPPEKLPLLAGYRQAFVNQGELIIAHGGSSLEEVTVPYVRITRTGAA